MQKGCSALYLTENNYGGDIIFRIRSEPRSGEEQNNQQDRASAAGRFNMTKGE